MARNALVISQSVLSVDPRVRRQIEWLAAEGWVVDSVGLGDRPAESVRRHFSMSDLPRLVRPKVVKGAIHLLVPFRARFDLLSRSRIPTAAAHRVRSGEYDLVLFNDLYLTPWAGDTSVFPSTRPPHVHLDLHEYHPPSPRRGALGERLVDGYYRWVRSFIGSPAIHSRSVVARGIGELYQKEFNLPPLDVVRNAPPFVAQEPTAVDGGAIRLLHHGIASWSRGLREMIDAVWELEDRFTLTLMLTGSARVISEVRSYIGDRSARVSVVPAVPMSELCTVINEFDLEIMFYPATTENLRLALPNKLFEAVQARLGLVIGSSPMMVEIVEEFKNGIVVDGWTDLDLRAAIRQLTVEEVSRMKMSSNRAAPRLSSEHEAKAFLRSIRAA